ncbi:hypothetical protein H8356DRAFT_1362738 [Neocallimastix lanati (nom. inval.)]|nr:hypothetical protein H8356DRAFT_1362738 [Neocallimastix sp. JGI-2020a]
MESKKKNMIKLKNLNQKNFYQMETWNWKNIDQVEYWNKRNEQTEYNMDNFNNDIQE